MGNVNFENVKAVPSENLITPENSVFLFVDHQPQMFFAVGNGDRGAIINATVGLGKAAKACCSAHRTSRLSNGGTVRCRSQ